MLEYCVEIHRFCCFFLTGLIWTIQLVHYPSFKYADQDNFTDYMTFHQMRISIIVIPIMLLELTLGTILLFLIPQGWTWINFVLLIGIWLSTFFLSVPKHNQLSQSFSPSTISQLVITNWPRTVLWTLRSGLIIYIS